MQYSTKKEALIKQMVDNLPALRALLNVSQSSLAEYIGIGRQSFIVIESGKTKMRWDTFVTLSMLFSSNSATAQFIDMLEIGTKDIEKYLIVE